MDKLEKIKKLCLGTREDCVIGMVLLATTYSKEEIFEMAGEKNRLYDFKAYHRGINKLYYKDLCIYVSINNCLVIVDKKRNYGSTYTPEEDKRFEELINYL